MSAASQRALEEHLRAERMSELSAEIYAALKAAEPLLRDRDSFLHGEVVTLIAKIEGWK
jgi:Tfp pilus assembly protein PilX